MAGVEEIETPPHFPQRLQMALRVAKKTRTRTQRELGLSSGYMGRLLSGERGSKALSPDLIRKLADYLGVAYEWLAIGRGPMHTGAWAPSVLESAAIVARTFGAREDAIRAAMDRYRNTENMTAWGWLDAIKAEAVLLDSAGVPRPEVVAKKQASLLRVGKKKRRQNTDAQQAAADEKRRAELVATVEKQNRAKGPNGKSRRGGAA